MKQIRDIFKNFMEEVNDNQKNILDDIMILSSIYLLLDKIDNRKIRDSLQYTIDDIISLQFDIEVIE